MQEKLAYIQDLLHRMTIRTDERGNEVRSSEDQVSWKAYREAENLDDPKWIDAAREAWEETKDDDGKRNIFFILSHLARSSGDPRAVKLMLEKFVQAHSKGFQAKLIDPFIRVPHVPDALPFLELSHSRDGSIRRDAIRVLGRCGRDEVSGRVLELLNDPEEDWDLIYTLWTVRDLGLEQSLPALLVHVHSANSEVRSFALRLISRFAGMRHAELFQEMLMKDRAPDVKWTAMEAIEQHGGEVQVEPVLKRVKTIVARQRKGGGQYPVSELMHGLSFLWHKAPRDKRVLQLFQELQSSKADRMFEHEKKRFSELIGSDGSGERRA